MLYKSDDPKFTWTQRLWTALQPSEISLLLIFWNADISILIDGDCNDFSCHLHVTVGLYFSQNISQSKPTVVLDGIFKYPTLWMLSKRRVEKILTRRYCWFSNLGTQTCIQGSRSHLPRLGGGNFCQTFAIFANLHDIFFSIWHMILYVHNRNGR